MGAAGYPRQGHSARPGSVPATDVRHLRTHRPDLGVCCSWHSNEPSANPGFSTHPLRVQAATPRHTPDNPDMETYRGRRRSPDPDMSPCRGRGVLVTADGDL